jgi:hypothetical protein
LPSNRVAIAPQTPMASASRLPRNDGRQPAACKTRKPSHIYVQMSFFYKKFSKIQAKCNLPSIYKLCEIGAKCIVCIKNNTQKNAGKLLKSMALL